MLKLGLRFLLLSVVLIAIGWLSFAPVFELIRVAAVGCLTAGLGLLILDYARTPDPSGG